MNRVLFVLFMFVLGCTRRSDRELVQRHDEIVAYATSDVPEFKAFKQCFPESRSFISYITGQNGDPTWNSKAPLFGRYMLEMTVPIRIDRETFRVTPTASPDFTFREISDISNASGREVISYAGAIPFSLADWEKLKAAQGDFDKIGIQLKKNQPVPNFGDFTYY